MSLAAQCTNRGKKRRISISKEEEEEQKPIAPTILLPQHLLPQEAAAVRSIVHVFDPLITGTISKDRLAAIVTYLESYVVQYNTKQLRDLIPEQSGDLSDDDSEDEEEDLDETDDESDEDKPEEMTKEDADFVVSDNEIEYEKGYEPKRGKQKAKEEEEEEEEECSDDDD